MITRLGAVSTFGGTPGEPWEGLSALTAPGPRYLLIESRSPMESPDVGAFADLAAGLADRGHPVDVVLVQNAVLMARAGAAGPLPALVERTGVTVHADDHSLVTRGADCADLIADVRLCNAAGLVELLLTSGCTPIWH